MAFIRQRLKGGIFRKSVESFLPSSDLVSIKSKTTVFTRPNSFYILPVASYNASKQSHSSSFKR